MSIFYCVDAIQTKNVFATLYKLMISAEMGKAMLITLLIIACFLNLQHYMNSQLLCCRIFIVLGYHMSQLNMLRYS